jgi:hypothetical protein
MVKSPINRSSSGNIKWGALAATGVVLLSLIPQLHLWYVRGGEWKGAYATLQGDEFLYSAYVNALIDGRPRRNDPFAGLDSTPKSPLPESAFSIQFVPAYVIALLARALGASASTAFIVLVGIAALLASLSVFWLLDSVTDDRKLAAVGVLFVLCCGALAGGQGLVGVLLNHTPNFFLPFLRRYQPAAVFPLFFVFSTLLWRMLTSENKRRARLYSILAGLILSVLVFSYLYLWTAAAAWLGCLALLWLWLRPVADRRRGLGLLSIVAAITIFSLIPYYYLAVRRATNLDLVQTLSFTHQPDLFRVPEIIGACILVLLAVGVRRRKIEQSDKRVIFAASFALLPSVVFNQQILTGMSMQPFHFENFAANYAALVSMVIAAALLWRSVSSRALVLIAMLCFLWGMTEVSLPTLARTPSDIVTDQMVPVLLRLKELSKQDGTVRGLQDEGKVSAVVFSPHMEVMGLLPTWTSQGTLLGKGRLDFGSASQKERKELLYAYLYYCQIDGRSLRELLNERTADWLLNSYTRTAIYGHERVIPGLSFNFKPIAQDEIEEEVRAYQSYVDSFSRETVLQHPLTYAITKAVHEPDLAHIDLWYERDAGESIGDYKLYRLRLRE